MMSKFQKKSTESCMEQGAMTRKKEIRDDLSSATKEVKSHF